MKFAAVLAAASASPTSFIMENWWAEANNVFNFAEGNWGAFAGAVDAVSINLMSSIAKYLILLSDYTQSHFKVE